MEVERDRKGGREGGREGGRRGKGRDGGDGGGGASTAVSIRLPLLWRRPRAAFLLSLCGSLLSGVSLSVWSGCYGIVGALCGCCGIRLWKSCARQALVNFNGTKRYDCLLLVISGYILVQGNGQLLAEKIGQRFDSDFFTC